MAGVQKFAFDMDFAADQKKAEVPRIDLAEHHNLVTHAREEGYQAGFAKAHDEAMQSIERSRAIALTAIGDAIARAVHALTEIEGRLEADALHIALAVGAKLAGKLIEREPLDGIRTMVADCLANMRQVPHLVVHVADAMFEDAQNELGRMAQESGYAGRLVIMADSALSPGDARIEWASGGIIIDHGEVERRISETIDNFLQGRHGMLPDTDNGEDT